MQHDEERGRRLLATDSDSEELNFKHLHYFHAVATAGSITRAAKSLGISQSTISEQIKMLERALDSPLFDRKRGGLRLNERGRRVYEHTKVMFRAARRLVNEVRPERQIQKWVLEVGLCPTVSRRLIGRRFLRLFELSEVTPRIRVGVYDDLTEDLLIGELDVVVSANPPSDIHTGKIGVEVLAEAPLVLVAAPAMAATVEQFPRDLAKLPFIQHGLGSRYRWELDSMFLDCGISPDVVAEADDIEFMSMAAENGVCAAALPRSVIEDALAEGKLAAMGPVANSSGGVYALYGQVAPSQVVRDALKLLQSDADG